ncbi:hypothetical protein [Hymenobacter sp. BT730]|uniref:hypothetical protein n=1 Tax=Hymenobacter sp. BT730 TaxID=3063332 RepID=UPI0026DFA053|nr:hypothetical protein [Hymenobacter sp. BT730]
MIEADLIKKHGKKAMGMEEHGHAAQTWRQRLPDILLEIGIIVFAITLSIQLHSWHEHSLEREKERKFLVGLRQDLQHDLQEMSGDSTSYITQMRAMRYYLAYAAGLQPADSVSFYSWTLRNTTVLIPNNSRFEGLKSVGGIDIVEDEELQAGILDHYQELIPDLVSESDNYSSYKQQHIGAYLDEHLAPDKKNFKAVFTSIPMQNYLMRGRNIPLIINKYHKVMQHSRGLIQQIDGQFGQH